MPTTATKRAPVVRVVIFRICNGRLQVLLLRSVERELRWELPGGKVKSEENPREALEREATEETGLEINHLTLRSGVIAQNSSDTSRYFYTAWWRRGEPKLRPREHDRYEWVNCTFADLAQFDLVKPSREFLQKTIFNIDEYAARS